MKSVKHHNPDLRKAIKVAQRAFKRSIDDPAGWKHKVTKEGSELLLLVVNIRNHMYEWFINIRGSLKGPLPRGFFISKCQSVTKLA